MTKHNFFEYIIRTFFNDSATCETCFYFKPDDAPESGYGQCFKSIKCFDIRPTYYFMIFFGVTPKDHVCKKYKRW